MQIPSRPSIPSQFLLDNVGSSAEFDSALDALERADCLVAVALEFGFDFSCPVGFVPLEWEIGDALWNFLEVPD